MLPLGKYYCYKKARSRNSFNVRMELETIETKATQLTSRLQRCDAKKAKETTSHASFGEILLLHKGEKQTLLHFQNKVKKIRDHKLRVQCRIYKHLSHIWHRRQQLLLPLGKYSCSINARGRNSFSVRMELETIETKSTQLTSRLQRCDPKTAKETTSHAFLGKYHSSIKARSRNTFRFKTKLVKTESTNYEINANLQTCDPHVAQETTAAASFGEILLFHKGEKQKLLHC